MLRDETVKNVLQQYALFHSAVKSKMPSRIYEADAGLATIRSNIRLLGHNRLLSQKQCEITESLLSESGKIVNAMVSKVKCRK